MKTSEKFEIFVRLHFLQVLWNFKGMQHLGCLFCLRPLLRRLYVGGEYAEAEKRHVSYFNTHPFFVSVCLGVVVKLEEQLKEGEFKKPELIPVFKNRMSGPLAAVGDAFFWETLVPTLASLGVVAVHLFGAGSTQAIATIAILLSIYIASVELIRWQGLGWGYQHGLGVVDVLKQRDFQGSMRRIRNAGAVLLGAASVFFIIQDGPLNLLLPLLRAAVLLGLIYATLAKISPTVQLYFMAAAAFGAGYLL